MKKSSNGRMIYESDDNYFDIIDTVDKAWCLGFLYADGYVNNSMSSVIVRLSIKDREILEKIKNMLSFQGVVKEYFAKCQSGEYLSCGIFVNSSKTASNLNRLGCTPKKSLILKFPTEEQVPSHLLSHFIRGYFDGDGCVTYRNSRNEAKVNFKGTEDFLKSLKDKLLDSGITSSVYKQSHGNAHNLDVHGYNNVVRFANWMYRDSETQNRLTRKHARFTDLFELIQSKRKKIRSNYEQVNIK